MEQLIDMDQDFDFGALSMDDRESAAGMQLVDGHDAAAAASGGSYPFYHDTELYSSLPDNNGGAQASTVPTGTTSASTTTSTTSDGVNSNVSIFQEGITSKDLDRFADDPHHIFKNQPAHQATVFDHATGRTTLVSALNQSAEAATGAEALTSSPPLTTMNSSSLQSAPSDSNPFTAMVEPLSTTTTTTLSSSSMLDNNSSDLPTWAIQAWQPEPLQDLDWASAPEVATNIDPTMAFGMSSYPTFEHLPIASLIAEQRTRKLTKQNEAEELAEIVEDMDMKADEDDNDDLRGIPLGVARKMATPYSRSRSLPGHYHQQSTLEGSTVFGRATLEAAPAIFGQAFGNGQTEIEWDPQPSTLSSSTFSSAPGLGLDSRAQSAFENWRKECMDFDVDDDGDSNLISGSSQFAPANPVMDDDDNFDDY